MRLTRALRAINSPSTEVRKTIEHVYKKQNRKRRHIVEPFLCTLSLDTIKDSLPAPGTCDVIDLNPGAGIWSRALHERLKPRRHILVESDRDQFASAIDPLLEDGSSYRYASSLHATLSLENGVFANDGEENRTDSMSAKHAKTSNYAVNNHLIFTANLAGHVEKSSTYQGDVAKQFLDQYFRSFSSRSPISDIHRNGLVKLLAWIPEKDKYTVFPRSVVGRLPLSIRLEASCHIREIVSSYPYSSTTSVYRRWFNADIENMRIVADKQKSSGFQIPPERFQPEPAAPSTALVPSRSNLKEMMKLELRPFLIDELAELDEHLASIDPAWLDSYWEWTPKVGAFSKQERERGARPVFNTVEQATYNELTKRLRTTHNAYKRTEEIVNDRRMLEHKVVQLAEEYGYNSNTFKQKVTEIEAELAILREATSKLFKDSRLAVEKAVDDYRAMRYNPPTLAWNNRTFEPILCKPSDFYPQAPMSLIELTPKLDFVQTFDTPEKQVCFDYVVFCLDWEKNAPLPVALKRIVGDEYEEFVSEIPNLFDPTKGGWYNLEHITSRSLPTSLFIEIALAFEQWPFRPSIEQMLTTTSSVQRQRKVRFH